MVEIAGIDLDFSDRRVQIGAAVVGLGAAFLISRSPKNNEDSGAITLTPGNGLSWADVFTDGGVIASVGAYPQQVILREGSNPQPGPGGNPVPEGVKVVVSKASCGIPGNRLAFLDDRGFLCIKDKATGVVSSCVSAGTIQCPSGRNLSAQPKPLSSSSGAGGEAFVNPTPGTRAGGISPYPKPYTGNTYATLRGGETIRQFSARTLGDANSWQRIASLNKGLSTPIEGMRLRLG